MEKEQKFILLNIIGTFFVLLGLTAIIKSIYRQTPTQILYMCYIGLILIGIGVLTRKTFIIMSQIYILAIPLSIWSIDFLYWIIFNGPLWGITDYFFLKSEFTLDKFVTLQHLYTIPLAIYATKLIGLKRKDAWKWSFIQITLVYIAVTILSPSESNVNCIFNPCINISLGLPYRLTWFLIIFGMTFITSVILNYFLAKKTKNIKKHNTHKNI